jgi:hypothetical protein
MFRLPNPPSPQAHVHELADFVELVSWDQGSASKREIVAYLGQVDDNANNIGCEDDDDKNSDLLDEVMNEIERRESACGSGYPFHLELKGTVLRHDMGNNDQRSILYRYLLLSTRLNMKDKRIHAGIDGASLLEEVAAHALKNYLGGARARNMVFGTATAGNFESKILAFCRELREGAGFRSLDGDRVQAQDDKLDVVAWLPFSDLLPGQLIVFGQCKTGSTWGSLVTQLQPENFIISEAADRARWKGTCVSAGLVLDRCRLVDFSDNLSIDLLKRVRRWTIAAKGTGKRSWKRPKKKRQSLRRSSSRVRAKRVLS